jgi:hypothetical protein
VYHAEEFDNAREDYYTEADQIRGSGMGGWPNSGDYAARFAKRFSSGSPKDNTHSVANN